MHPIWKDYTIDLSAYGSPVTWRLLVGADEVFRGEATARPDGTNDVRINDILAPLLAQQLPPDWETAGAASYPPVVLTAVAQYSADAGETWTQVASETFVMDWSYEPLIDVATAGMNAPIQRVFDPAFPLVFSRAVAGDVTILFDATDGDFNDDYNADFFIGQDATLSYNLAGAGNVVLPGGTIAGRGFLSFTGHHLAVEAGCARYALYYVNAFGGWDAFIIRSAAVQEADALTRSEHRQRYDNRVTTARGRVNYRNDIAKRWTFRTGTLSDGEAARMYHLLESTRVYLYDRTTAEFTPVVLTGDEVTFKTYRSEGRSLVSYTITADEARDRQRRG